LYTLLDIASVDSLGSESLETHDHILHSQILDFPFRRLLRLVGSRWRYSPRLHTGVSVKVKATLRLTVSQSVSFGAEPHLGLMSRYLLLFDSYGLVSWGDLSDKKTVLSFVNAAGQSQVAFLGSESLGTRGHILLSQI
jgi:hypothetical protein